MTRRAPCPQCGEPVDPASAYINIDAKTGEPTILHHGCTLAWLTATYGGDAA